MMELLFSMPGAITLGLIWSLMALGVFISYKVLDIPDLTVDGSFATGGAVCIIVLNSGGHFVLALLAGFVAGLLCGLVTGLLHTLLGVPAILAGILTQGALWSINLLVLGSSNKAMPWGTNVFVHMTNPHSIWMMACVVLAFAALLYLFFGTELGASIRATGNNQRMSRAIGINTKFNTVLGLMISNGLVAFSGAILAQYQGNADIKMGMGAIVIGLCAVVIGLSITSKISSNFLVRMLGVVGGAIIYFIIYQAAVTFLKDPNLLKLLASVIVALFLGIPYLYKKYLAKHFKKKEKMVKEG